MFTTKFNGTEVKPGKRKGKPYDMSLKTASY